MSEATNENAKKEVLPVLQFDLETVREVAALLRESELGEICIETTDEKSPRARLLMRRAPSSPVAPNAAPADALASTEIEANASDALPSTPIPAGVKITSPAVGVFRPAKVPVKIGDEVAIKQVVGVVESLRIPNEIISTVAGRVLELGAQDGQGIEYGQTLFVIEEI